MQARQQDQSSKYVRARAIVLCVLVTLCAIEGCARIIYAYQDELFSLRKLITGSGISGSLDPYEVPSSDQAGHWRLKPGFETTYAQYMLDKDSKAKGVARVMATNVPPDSDGARIFRVNKNGFKGEEVSLVKNDLRILMLGDSVTFGLLTDDYPHYVQAYLESRNIDVEVINGGVEGYAVHNLLYELDRYKAVEPDVVTIYIGWNNIFSPREWLGRWESRIRILWLVREFSRSVRIIFNDKREASIQLRDRELRPRQEDFRWVDDYEPPALEALEALVRALRKAGAVPVLVTLPGMYEREGAYSDQMLKIGHLPEYTDNPYLFAAVTSRFNAGIRDIARELDAPMIDLSAWGRENLSDKVEYFSDSVHLTPTGLKSVGRKIAESLVPIIKSVEDGKSVNK